MSDLNLMLLFMVKHFICDFPLQACPWMYRNKGTYGHVGGITHAAIHGGTTLLLVNFVIPSSVWSLYLSFGDFILHYHIDYAKMKIGSKFNLKPDNSEWFWILLGFDQLLHFLTYYLIIVLIQRNIT